MGSLDTSAFTRKFVEEARDRLKSLSAALLRLEQAPGSDDIIAEVFREAHSLKGSALMLGFVDISQIAHQLEELFVVAKRDARVIDASAFDLVFRSLDVVSTRVEELARGNSEPVDTTELCRKLAALVVHQNRAGRRIDRPTGAPGDAVASGPRPAAPARSRRAVGNPGSVSRCACRWRSWRG